MPSKPRQIAFRFDASSLLTAEQLAQHGGLARIARGRACDCCGARELHGGCIRGLLPCDCDRLTIPLSDRFQSRLAFMVVGMGVRCNTCWRCPEHCGCEEEAAL